MRLGDLEVHLVGDGVVHVDAGGVFGLVPQALYARYHAPAPDNTVPMSLNCLLVRSRGLTILIDTGLGSKLDADEVENWRLARPEGGLLEGLETLGVLPGEIDIVINTHLHADHCGGNTRRLDGRAVATFPQATYWVQRMEWADASHPDARTRGTYQADNFAPLMAEGRLKLLHGDTEVTDEVRCVATPGHSRGHQSVLLHSGGKAGLYVGDMATYAVLMTHTAWVTAYDVEPLETIRSKSRWQDWALKNDAWLFFEHDPRTPVARLVLEGERLGVQAVG
jgi:glyoxylase-like metal-dependent hydrolase (beta-lactamase superfamily II)